MKNEVLKSGDKVFFNNKILTLDKFDSWFNKWDFIEENITPVEYQEYDPPVKLHHYGYDYDSGIKENFETYLLEQYQKLL